MRWLMLALLVAAAGCVEQGAAPSASVLSFMPDKVSCASEQAVFGASRSGGVISFSGAVDTSTPCYSLSATHSVSNDVVQVQVSAKSRGGMCIQCVGQIQFNGTVSGLEDREYTFIISKSEKVLFEKKV
jgi:hypothetical protein